MRHPARRCQPQLSIAERTCRISTSACNERDSNSLSALIRARYDGRVIYSATLRHGCGLASKILVEHTSHNGRAEPRRAAPRHPIPVRLADVCAIRCGKRSTSRTSSRSVFDIVRGGGYYQWGAAALSSSHSACYVGCDVSGQRVTPCHPRALERRS